MLTQNNQMPENIEENRTAKIAEKVQKTEEIVTKVEVPIIKEKPSKSLPDMAFERRMQLMENLIKKIGLRNARKRQKSLSQYYKVSERTIRADFDWIKGNIKPEDIKELKITLKVARDRALDEALERFNEDSSIDNSKKIMDLSKSYREELEAWGEKPKVAEKIEHSGQLGVDIAEIRRKRWERQKAQLK